MSNAAGKADKQEQSILEPMENKEQGWVFLNGNVATEVDLVKMFSPQMLNPQHPDPEINQSRKVLLVTAAFHKGHEHHDRHLIEMFERLGIDAKWKNSFPTNIQNLSVYSMFSEFITKEKWLYRRYTEKQDLLKAIKKDYHVKNQDYLDTVTALTDALEFKHPHLGLFDFYHWNRFDDEDFMMAGLSTRERKTKIKQIEPLKHSAVDMDMCRELSDTVEHLVYKDEEILALCQNMEAFFLEKSGVWKSALYQDHREELKQRIINSATCVLFGGRVFVLNNRLRFYRLDEVFQEALRLGTNFYGISAGAMSLQDRFYLSFPRDFPGGFMRVADLGIGLVKGLSVFPHANDYLYIRRAHQDELSLYTVRHRGRVTVGLNEKTVLLYERYRDPLDDQVYDRYSSVGDDPVLVFGERGRIVELNRFDELLLEGTKFYDSLPRMAMRQDICEFEQAWRKETQ
ncbi:MAG: Type 1 glutamine amidotransferase-like domain-containing protein [bacterium]|nr:Type 1 glutamine amidotransferase-like domain-containing protein [bacterium]